MKWQRHPTFRGNLTDLNSPTQSLLARIQTNSKLQISVGHTGILWHVQVYITTTILGSRNYATFLWNCQVFNSVQATTCQVFFGHRWKDLNSRLVFITIYFSALDEEPASRVYSSIKPVCSVKASQAVAALAGVTSTFGNLCCNLCYDSEKRNIITCSAHLQYICLMELDELRRYPLISSHDPQV